MKFSECITKLLDGSCAKRKKWNKYDGFIYTEEGGDYPEFGIIGNIFIREYPEKITLYEPSGEDVDAEDWEIINEFSDTNTTADIN